ncbi:DHA2 family multidrug resistance protein-like MFS transporter [Kribbella voronezhensis]|uniref:DHA2 family multidrug resistance protein-like MFS transporter n=1 Tax=Kribbella voronezhensis TaxID=2512212 RepID=A0A4R7SXE5_9ACTN|nr:MFS transporter [Kribbella voronezhensis]TDU83346.1 DHA2 family multidrug resistance protein-like MFS transporter [Kribbella voronezhensis]
MTLVSEVDSVTTGKRQWIALGVLCLATLLVSLDLFVMLLAVPAVTEALGATSTQQLWILDVYGFMVAGLMITMGNLGDRLGRRRLLLIAAAVFGVASIVAAYSVNPGMLIGARAVLGIAGAALTPCSLSLISTLFPDARQRATALGVWAGCFTVGAIVGPIVGGVLLNHFWWGSAFLIGVPAMVVLLIVGPILLPEYRNEQAGRIDGRSVLLSLAAILPAIHGLKHLASHGADAQAVVSLVAGGVFGWVFVRRQQRLAEPLVDVRLFTRRTFSVVLGSMMTYSMLSGGVMVFVAQYFQLVKGLTPLEAGLALVPGMVTSTIGFQLAPRLAQRIRPGILIPAGVAFTVAGMVVMSVATSTTVLVVAFAVEAFGPGALVILGTNLVIGSVPPEKAGMAGGLTQTSNEFGYSLGIAVLGSVVTAAYRSHMEGRGGNSLGEAVTKGLPADVLEQARHAFTSGLHLAAAITALTLAGMATLLAVTLRKQPTLDH